MEISPPVKLPMTSKMTTPRLSECQSATVLWLIWKAFHVNPLTLSFTHSLKRPLML